MKSPEFREPPPETEPEPVDEVGPGLEPEIGPVAGGAETEPFLELSDAERETITEALGAFRGYVEGMEKAPDVVVYADTAARPLYYAANPIIERAAARRGGGSVPSVFAAPNVSLSGTSEQKGPLTTRAGDTEEEFVRRAREEFSPKVFEMMGADGLKEMFDGSQERLKNELRAQGSLEERIREVCEKLKLGEGSDILIVDDYFSGGRTMKAFQKAFDQVVPQARLHKFAMMAAEIDSEVGDELGVVVGIQDPVEGGSPGFAWRRDSESIGVKKSSGDYESKYSSKAPDADSARMKGLRRELRRLGQAVAEDADYGND